MKASIYIHIPFCLRKCLYCDFASYNGKEHLIGSYVKALKAEIRMKAERFSEVRVPTIYFGGGTPNVLASDQLAEILDEIRRGFQVTDDAEITLEANPGIRQPLTINHQPLSDAGFNRLSLGIQSSHDNELKALGRIHTAEEAIRAFHEAREAGFRNISVDLMFGIPKQTLESWRSTLDAALDLDPEHISLYSLTIEEGTPFHDLQVQGRLTLPGTDTEADMFQRAIDSLTSAGFQHYEVSNFARPGFECLHNLTYWRNEPYLGFGVAAASGLNAVENGEVRPKEIVRSANTASVEQYIRVVHSCHDPVESSERLAGRASMGETMFLGLRMLRGVDIEGFRRRYGVSPDEVFQDQIADLIERGLLERVEGHIRLTNRGLFLANEVFAEFV